MDTKVPRKFQPKITPYNSAPKSSLAPSILQFCKYRSAKEIQEELLRGDILGKTLIIFYVLEEGSCSSTGLKPIRGLNKSFLTLIMQDA